MGLAARRKATAAMPRRVCGNCGLEKPVERFRQMRQGCTDAPDAQVCGECEARYVREGFLHQRRDGRLR